MYITLRPAAGPRMPPRRSLRLQARAETRGGPGCTLASFLLHPCCIKVRGIVGAHPAPEGCDVHYQSNDQFMDILEDAAEDGPALAVETPGMHAARSRPPDAPAPHVISVSARPTHCANPCSDASHNRAPVFQRHLYVPKSRQRCCRRSDCCYSSKFSASAEQPTPHNSCSRLLFVLGRLRP